MIKAGEELLRLQAENIRLKEGIKQAREEIQKCVDMLSDDTVADLNMKSGLGLALEKIDKLIESEG
jgi:hypothetical protein